MFGAFSIHPVRKFALGALIPTERILPKPPFSSMRIISSLDNLLTKSSTFK